MKSNSSNEFTSTVLTLAVVGFLLIGYTMGGGNSEEHKEFSNQHVYTTHKDTIKTNKDENISSSN